MTTYLQDREQQMFALLKELVVIQSGSRHKDGIDRVAREIATFLSDSSVVCQTVVQPRYGNHLIVRSPVDRTLSGRQALLVGHMDTVFPHDTEFNWYKEDTRHSYGPGVVDMKGGLVAGLFAIKALDAAGFLKRIPLTFILNSDEEIGSVTSGALIREEARNSAFAFVLECGGLNGELVTGRKGNLTARLDVTGEAGHAAFAGQDKRSAILELAHKIIALEALNAPGEGITVNVGWVQGGIGPNTIPAQATAHVDFRFPTSAAGLHLENRLAAIVAEHTVSNTAAIHQFLTRRPPMPANAANQRLFTSVQSLAFELGMQIGDEFRQGVSDANLIADEKVPVIDGLGPVGGKDHSAAEYMVKESLLHRSILLACAIPACWEQFRAGQAL